MSENWNEIELKASVEAYIEMHNLEGRNKPFSKKRYYTELAKRFGRTEKAYEYRMQNISYVYSLQGRQWVSGLKPARNVGAKVIQTLERIIAECEGQTLGSNTSFLATIEKLEGVLDAPPPPGSKSPSKVQTSVTPVFTRPRRGSLGARRSERTM